jgi:ABC-type multidrug transport system fused ATPase/permease subunit
MDETSTMLNVASSSKETILEEFVRSKTEQPGKTTVKGTQLEVPLIDFSNPNEENVVREIIEASCEWGMFQIVNHEIPLELITKLQSVGKAFFELPQDEKEQYAKPPDSQSIEGYGSKLSKGVDNKRGWVEHLFHKIWPPSDINYHFWPKNPPSYRLHNSLSILLEFSTSNFKHLVVFFFFSLLILFCFCLLLRRTMSICLCVLLIFICIMNSLIFFSYIILYLSLKKIRGELALLRDTI